MIHWGHVPRSNTDRDSTAGSKGSTRSKKEIIEKTACQALWGDPMVSREVLPAANSAGGILCMWSDEKFKLESKVSGNGFIRLTGQWAKEAVQIHIVVVYSPCDIQNKRIL